ncbi:MAG: trypsin-like peptidase domain-containing protein, partial [Candidatus Zixiibacteriota bacterium]
MERNHSSIAFLALALSIAPGVFQPVHAQSAPPGLQERIYQARDRVLPALVHIQPVISDYRTGKLVKQSVVGSGIVIHKDGYVVTNFHVAGKAEHILCTMANKEQVKATLVGGDPPTDLAVIKLDLADYSGKLAVSEFGDSDSLQVGQQVMALGSPLALARSVTFGVISTLDRYFPDDTRLPTGERTGQYNLWLQTDAAINPGNSGGPLVDLDGRIVGINSRATVFANNIGFSIPSNIVRRVTSELIRNGKVVRSRIGIHCQPLQELEDWFGSGELEGVLISSIDPDSPSDIARLRAGDIIQSINGAPVSARFVEQIPDVYRTIAEYEPGTELSLVVRRKDELFTVLVKTVELGELQGEDLECPVWGFAVKAITQQMALDYNLNSLNGVYISGVKRTGPAFSGGLRSGDVIVGVDELTIDDLAQFSRVYQERQDKVSVG